MGTRADFYVGIDKPEWIGSIAWDGYPTGLDDVMRGFFDGMERARFDKMVEKLAKREDWTPASDGWPWPWDDSSTTDYAYAWHDDKLWILGMVEDDAWVTWDGEKRKFTEHHGALPKFNDKNVKLGGPGSGLIVVTGGPA